MRAHLVVPPRRTLGAVPTSPAGRRGLRLIEPGHGRARSHITAADGLRANRRMHRRDIGRRWATTTRKPLSLLSLFG